MVVPSLIRGGVERRCPAPLRGPCTLSFRRPESGVRGLPGTAIQFRASRQRPLRSSEVRGIRTAHWTNHGAGPWNFSANPAKHGAARLDTRCVSCHSQAFGPLATGPANLIGSDGRTFPTTALSSCALIWAVKISETSARHPSGFAITPGYDEREKEDAAHKSNSRRAT